MFVFKICFFFNLLFGRTSQKSLPGQIFALPGSTQNIVFACLAVPILTCLYSTLYLRSRVCTYSSNSDSVVELYIIFRIRICYVLALSLLLLSLICGAILAQSRLDV